MADESAKDSLLDSFDETTNLFHWEAALREIHGEKPAHPILIALKDTIERSNLPLEPFLDLLSAFKQDQIKNRYETFSELLNYCVRSANPVGRIYLGLFGVGTEERFELSDKICTGLQLANFWQDIVRDWEKGRIYIPLEDMRRFGYTEEDLKNRVYSARFVELMKYQTTRTREFFREGARLEVLLPRRLAFEIKLFHYGGEEVLNKIEKLNWNVLQKRPVIGKSDKLKLFLRAIL